MKLFKVYFIDPSNYPIFVVAKSFDDAAEEVKFQIISYRGKAPTVERIDVIADENGSLSCNSDKTPPRLMVARNYDRSLIE